MAISSIDIVERLGCLLRTEAGSRDHGLPEIVSAMRDAKAEIERLREALRNLIEACEDGTEKIPYGDGDDELQRAKRVLGDE